MHEPTFRLLYERHFDHVWHTLRRFGVAERELEDAAHDVFVVVHRKLGEFDARRSARAWLSGIAWRVAADTRRRAHHRREQLDARAGVDRRDRLPAPDEVVAAREARLLVEQALATIDLDQRAVLMLCDIDGASGPEAAEALGVPLNTVYSRLRTARARFGAAVRRLTALRGAA